MHSTYSEVPVASVRQRTYVHVAGGDACVPMTLGMVICESGARLRHIYFLHVLLRYTQALITQAAQTAVCNRHHAHS